MPLVCKHRQSRKISLDAVSNAVNKSGVATDDIFLSDLETLNLDRYKVVVIANAWRLTSQQRNWIKSRVQSQGFTGHLATKPVNPCCQTSRGYQAAPIRMGSGCKFTPNFCRTP